MTNLTDIKSIEQRDIEKAFAVQAWRYPLYTVKNCGWLRSDIFLDPSIRKFWGLLVTGVSSSMSEDDAAIEATSAALVAKIDREFQKWAYDVPTNSMPESYASEVVRRAYIYNASMKLPDLASAISDSDDKKIREVVSDIGDNISAGGIETSTTLEVAESFAEVVRTRDRVVKTSTALDRAIGGLERQTEIILAARPSMGKTALAWQIARCVANNGKKVFFSSLEMSRTSLWARAACPRAQLSWVDVLSENVTDGQIQNLIMASGNLANKYKDTIFIDDRPKTTDDIWRTAVSLGPDLVIVDHLRLLKDEIGDNEVRRLGYCSERLRDMAKSCNIPVLLLCQLSRAPESRPDKRPTLADLRESGHIEENADVVLMMYRDDYYNPTLETLSSDESLTEVHVRKFRDGPQNTRVNLVFNKKNEWFEGR